MNISGMLQNRLDEQPASSPSRFFIQGLLQVVHTSQSRAKCEPLSKHAFRRRASRSVFFEGCASLCDSCEEE